MRITRRLLKRVIAEEYRKLHEDSIDSELDHLRKNVNDDLDHIKDLKDDIKDDHEEELHAEKEKRKHEGRVRMSRSRLRKIVREALTQKRRR